MLKTVKEFFETQFLSERNKYPASSTHTLELAAAVLMLEISLADSTIGESEHKVVEAALRNVFHLTAEETNTIIDLAKQEVDHAVSLYDFTSLINRAMTPEERIKIIELLWEVACADAIIDKYEEYYVRKIADLLYIPHSDYIKAKHKAGA